MADGGWIKLYRVLLDDDLWINCTPVQKVVMVTLLLMANHKERKWIWQGKKFSAKPGQMVTSLESIKGKSGKGVSIRAVRTSLTKFESVGFLTSESTNSGRLVTIANWAKYQEGIKEVTNELTGNRQATDKQVTTNKNDKNDKKKTPSSDALLDRFNALWKLYPKKLGKQNSFKAYKKAIKDGATDDQIKTGIEAYVKYLTKEQTDPQYIKQGSSFFNQRSWEDDWSGGGVTPEPQAPKPIDKAAAALREIRDEMALYPGVPLEEAAELAAKGLTENGRPTTAEKILKFLDKYGGEVNE
jgi:hypothetical protein